MTTTSHDRHQLERLIFFSDAVFAIAMTLLVVDVHLPRLPVVSEAALAQALIGLIPQYIGFLISFLVVGRFWIGHHRAFGWLARSDDRLVWLNLIFLLTIAFMPFPTTLISAYASTRLGVGVYAGWLIIAGLANVAVERHAAKAGLAVTDGAAALLRLARTAWSPVAIGVAALACAMVTPLLALLPLCLSPIVVRLFRGRGRRQELA